MEPSFCVNASGLHHLSTQHRTAIEASKVCGCFYCLRTFPPTDIREWIDLGRTALCPHCKIDAVLPDAYGFTPSEDLLAAMHERWFTEEKI